jgi:feruloyl esterase
MSNLDPSWSKTRLHFLAESIDIHMSFSEHRPTAGSFMTNRSVVPALFLSLCTSPLFAQSPQACDGLRSISLANTVVTTAAVVSGSFTPPGATNPNATIGNLPAFCRVAATLKPTADSEIRTEIWLPMSGWNRRLQSVGNGAWAGTIPYAAMAAAVTGGYATAGTDTGHTGNTASFAPGHPERLVDYGYRGVHEMTVAAKAIVRAFYGDGPRYSYWNGCSTGGRQGLMEAQRYPADYDGVIAGAPVNARVHQLIWELWVAQAVHRDDASYIPPAKYRSLNDAVLAKCDGNDGAKDGLLTSPDRCSFDPGALQCKAGDAESCLTTAQVEAARKIYAPARNPRTGKEIFPALQPGSELGWAGLAGPEPVREAVEFFQYVVFNDQKWDFRTLDFDRDVDRAEKAASQIIDATDPDLQPFFSRGGKVLLYHGWNDQLVAPMNSVNYYQSVVGTTRNATESIRLFMMPGMTHCRGGIGPDNFDRMGVIERWVEQGEVPKQITAEHSTNGVVDRRRPLCPHPQVAAFSGAGDLDEAASFVCRTP